MVRNRAYYRKMRAKHIHRKKKIVNNVYNGFYYSFDGMYSKNKIHCSCIMCRGKNCLGKHIKTRQEIKKMTMLKILFEKTKNL